LLRYIKHNEVSDLVLGSAIVPSGELVELGSISGMYDNAAKALYYYLGTGQLSVYDDKQKEVVVQDEGFYQEFIEIISKGITIDFKAAEDDQSARKAAIAYLDCTGWYIERLNDPSSGKEVPEEVLTLRAEARDLLNS